MIFGVITVILYIIMFSALSLIIRCPRCGRSVFFYKWGVFNYAVLPWPAKTCSKCGLDLRDVQARLWRGSKSKDGS